MSSVDLCPESLQRSRGENISAESSPRSFLKDILKPPQCDAGKYYESASQAAAASPLDSWGGVLASLPSVPSLGAPPAAVPLWRSQSAGTLPSLPSLPKPWQHAPVVYAADADCGENWREQYVPKTPGAGSAVVTPHGTICLRLPYHIRVELTVDRAVRIVNFKNNIVLALSESGSSAGLLHPNGRIHQYGSRVEIMALDAKGNHKYAKMWYKGVSFTSDRSALVYLVDAAGTRTTSDSFSDLRQDVSLTVFFGNSRHGAACVDEAKAALGESQFWLNDEGVSNWIINNVRVSQTADGLIRVARNSNKYLMRTSPSNGTASLTTPFIHCTASLGQTSHMFVRRGERRMHFDCSSFIVRNAGHSAGFDDHNKLKVY
ncbi:uncharacterized protein LOC134530344 [Bacillus rossius redtenbacheri]|uniref:uncharacterized protein LOC134530344 n=1 Tax=Bacillus rossius redtenbacheri TaxID=93214 RepID=UPI002FDEE4B7